MSSTKSQLLKIILNYIIYLNFVIATSAGILASGVANILDIEDYVYYGLLGFCSTLCVYNSQRLFKANIDTKTYWLKWVIKHRKLIVFLCIISGLIACFLFIKLLNDLRLTTILIMFTGVIISFFYVVKIGKKNLREFPHLKIHSIALTWTLVIVLFPLVNKGISDWEIIMIFVPAHYMYFVAVAIPFDIRDLKHDSQTQRTIPQAVGIRNSKLISILLLILTTIGIGYIFSNIFKTLIFGIAILTQIILIGFTTVNRQEVYYSVLIDGTIGLLGISYLTIKNLCF